eukprot:gnl/MRDRNA2_/MRDRNA2_142695_c0_seq1.p1 gnl/MRDRNA2_/MRDRNA2_142695_c0~~gnl/MRDRNA2_/MRDRNA2_142695_c0_seq1.p1  ORF type:complete len:190 (+),score=43.14 gnl/MRDRNA2_/MRDRNA2_142695_c0_seq1:100-669(+)
MPVKEVTEDTRKAGKGEVPKEEKLMVICMDGCNWRGLERLIKQGADVNWKNAVGHTPLMSACESGNPKMVQMLLDAGARVNSKNNPAPVGPLLKQYPKGMTALDCVGRRIETLEIKRVEAAESYDVRQAENKEKNCTRSEIFPECRKGETPYSPYSKLPQWYEIKEMLLAKDAKIGAEAPDEGLFGMFN